MDALATAIAWRSRREAARGAECSSSSTALVVDLARCALAGGAKQDCIGVTTNDVRQARFHTCDAQGDRAL